VEDILVKGGEMLKFLVNQEVKIRYIALDFKTGLTDLTATVRKPDGTSIDATVSEIGDGAYEISFTPDAVGLWQIKVTSASNGDKAILSVDVVDKDITTVDQKIDNLQASVDEKASQASVDNLQASVNNLDSKIDNIDTELDGKANQSSLDEAHTKLDNIESKVDNIDTQIRPGGYFA